MDRGENLDVSQVLSPGGTVTAGQSFNNQLYGQGMAQDTVTAHAGGGQANGVPVVGPMIRVTVVASAGDSITLPPSVRGMQVIVLNDAAANAMNVFPATGETINAGAANAALSVAAQNGAGTGPTIFYCFTNGAWRTK
jgi:hypothetical protein